MSDQNLAIYYLGREQQETRIADAAINPAIAAIHRDMAGRYAQLALDITAQAKLPAALHPA